MQKRIVALIILILSVSLICGATAFESTKASAAATVPIVTAVSTVTATSAPVATRIRHVTVKPRATETATATARLQLTATPIPTISSTATSITGLGGSIEATVQAYIAQTKAVTASKSITNSAIVAVAQPVRLVIPSLKVDVSIESVGKDKNGAMDIPSKAELVAWYALGSAPGQIGNAVIAGHLDLVDGSPAVFWNIGKLKKGDEVIVYDASGDEHHFRVIGSQRYQYDSAPVEDIFGYALRSQLNLITCAGTWNRESGNYSNRLVVYTELITQS